MLSSGSLQIKQAMRTNAPLEEFSAHMDERIPALMAVWNSGLQHRACAGQ